MDNNEMVEILIHTPDGKLEVEPTVGTPLARIELDNEEELLAPFAEYLARMQALDEGRERGAYWGPNARTTILNFYKKLKKNNCEVISGPRISRAGYVRGTVRYPDGRIRRWGSRWGNRWYVDK